jgi:Flp pilus assembly protein TadB
MLYLNCDRVSLWTGVGFQKQAKTKAAALGGAAAPRQQSASTKTATRRGAHEPQKTRQQMKVIGAAVMAACVAVVLLSWVPATVLVITLLLISIYFAIRSAD